MLLLNIQRHTQRKGANFLMKTYTYSFSAIILAIRVTK